MNRRYPHVLHRSQLQDGDFISTYFGTYIEKNLIAPIVQVALKNNKFSVQLRHIQRVKDFFIDNYDHPMFDNGIQLVDMIYLSKAL